MVAGIPLLEIKKPKINLGFLKIRGCIDLFSHQASLALPSALKSLTSEFGMGSGVSSSLITHPNWIYSNKSINFNSELTLYTLIRVYYASYIFKCI